MRVVAFVAVLAAAGQAAASDQTGVYGKITSVEYEPTAGDVNTATKVKVGGNFTVVNGPVGSGDSYTAAAQGFLYYSCPAGQDSVCRMEWADIKKAVGASDCATWGSRSQFPTPGLGSVRSAATGTADSYPIAMGVMRTSLGQCPKLGGSPPVGDMAGAPPADMATGGTLEPKNTGCSSVPGAAPTAAALLGLLSFVLAVGLNRRKG